MIFSQRTALQWEEVLMYFPVLVWQALELAQVYQMGVVCLLKAAGLYLCFDKPKEKKW